MKKITTLFFALVCSLFCFQAAFANELNTDQVYLFGNCKSSDLATASLFGMSDGKTHTFAGASLLDIEALKAKGTVVLGIRVYIGDAINTGRVFLGKDYQNPLVSKDFTYKRGGWQYVMFDEAYELGEESIYIGFEAKGAGSFLALENLGKSVDSEMISIDNGAWGNVKDMIMPNLAWSIQAIVAGGDYSAEVQNDLVVERATAAKSVKAGEPIALQFELRNAGIVPMEKAYIEYVVKDKKDTVLVEERLLNGQTAMISCNEIIAPEIEEAYAGLTIKVRVIDEDEVATNNETSVDMRVYTSLAVKRNKMLIEQFTGQACGYCPGGAEVLKASIAGMENPDDVIWVAHHAGYAKDDFTLTESLEIAGSLRVSGAPNCAVNRMPVDYVAGKSDLVWHPAYSTTELLEDLTEIPGLATMELTVNYTEENRMLVVGIKGNLIVASANITVLVKQSGIIAKQANGGNNYEHNNAPRFFLTGSKGNKLDVDSAGNYEISYVYNVPAAVGKFACEGKMDVVAFVHGDIQRAATSMVYNADQVSFEVKNITDVEYSYTNDMRIYPNPTTDMLFVDGLNEGDVLKVYTIDGVLVKEQEVVNVNEALNVSDMPQGTYFLHVNQNVVKFVKK
jgi:hypothetical protein